MSISKKNQFIVWKVYQRRAESISRYLDLQIKYFHFKWEEKSRLLKAISYPLKFVATLIYLLKTRPRLVLLQLPPTPALYVTSLYCAITKIPYVADCHNAMFMGGWVRWPLAKYLLRNAAAVLVHNKEVEEVAKQLGVDVKVMRDPLPQPPSAPGTTGVLERLGLTPRNYVIAPWNLASDEPMAEFVDAVRALPDIRFAMTWYAERMPEDLKDNLPPNLTMTGYLEANEFNDLFKYSGLAISLTIREGTQPSAASEAIAFEVPLVLSDMETARDLYGDAPCFVKNTPRGIVAGIRQVMDDREKYLEGIRDIRERINNDLEQEINSVKRDIAAYGLKL